MRLNINGGGRRIDTLGRTFLLFIGFWLSTPGMKALAERGPRPVSHNERIVHAYFSQSRQSSEQSRSQRHTEMMRVMSSRLTGREKTEFQAEFGKMETPMKELDAVEARLEIARKNGNQQEVGVLEIEKERRIGELLEIQKEVVKKHADQMRGSLDKIRSDSGFRTVLDLLPANYEKALGGLNEKGEFKLEDGIPKVLADALKEIDRMFAQAANEPRLKSIKSQLEQAKADIEKGLRELFDYLDPTGFNLERVKQFVQQMLGQDVVATTASRSGRLLPNHGSSKDRTEAPTATFAKGVDPKHLPSVMNAFSKTVAKRSRKMTQDFIDFFEKSTEADRMLFGRALEVLDKLYAESVSEYSRDKSRSVLDRLRAKLKERLGSMELADRAIAELKKNGCPGASYFL